MYCSTLNLVCEPSDDNDETGKFRGELTSVGVGLVTGIDFFVFM